jgi:type I restriction enzyme M protein
MNLRSADATEVFRRLYYHLYSNSSTSRADRIIEDLSRLLLGKLAVEELGQPDLIDGIIAGSSDPDAVLIPLLARRFPAIVQPDDAFSLDAASIRLCLSDLSEVNLRESPAHVLGDAFQALMGSRLRGERGQFFTPRSVVRCIVDVLSPEPGAVVVDPACGTGGFLVEAYRRVAPDAVNRRALTLVGVDKDRDLFRLASALTATLTDTASIINADALDLAGLSNQCEILQPGCADYVMTNPPFGSKIGVTTKRVLEQHCLGHDWSLSKREGTWTVAPGLRPTQDPQVLFIELALRLLKVGGRLGIVLPEGVFGNSGTGYVLDFLRANGEIEALVDCPRTTFQPGTDTKTNILFFKRTSEQVVTGVGDGRSGPVWVAVALDCGHDKRGLTTLPSGKPVPDDFCEIGRTYSSGRKDSQHWTYVNVDDPYYLVPRYLRQQAIHRANGQGRRAEEVTIGQLSSDGHLIVRKGHEVGAEAYGTGDVPFVRTSDIANLEVSADPTKSVGHEYYERYAPIQKLQPLDILLVADGRYRIGKTAILHEHNFHCIVQSHVRIITVLDSSPLSAWELLYLLNTPDAKTQMRDLAFVQSTLGVLGSRLNQLRLALPKRDESWSEQVGRFQRAIQGRAALMDELAVFESPEPEI